MRMKSLCDFCALTTQPRGATIHTLWFGLCTLRKKLNGFTSSSRPDAMRHARCVRGMSGAALMTQEFLLLNFLLLMFIGCSRQPFSNRYAKYRYAAIMAI